MLDLQLNIEEHTARRLEKILEQVEDQEIFARNIIAYQVSELKRAIFNIEKDIVDFEEKYQMSTKAFYYRFKEGEAGDSEDFMIWAGLYEMLLENQKRLLELK